MKLLISTSSAYLDARRKISIRYHKAIDGFDAQLHALRAKHKKAIADVKAEKAAYVATHKKVVENLDKKYKIPPMPKAAVKKVSKPVRGPESGAPSAERLALEQRRAERSKRISK